MSFVPFFIAEFLLFYGQLFVGNDGDHISVIAILPRDWGLIFTRDNHLLVRRITIIVIIYSPAAKNGKICFFRLLYWMGGEISKSHDLCALNGNYMQMTKKWTIHAISSQCVLEFNDFFWQNTCWINIIIFDVWPPKILRFT